MTWKVLKGGKIATHNNNNGWLYISKERCSHVLAWVIFQLPYSLDWQTLKKHFQQVGDVRFAEVKMDGGKSAGWGLICFRKEEDAQRAISMYTIIIYDFIKEQSGLYLLIEQSDLGLHCFAQICLSKYLGPSQYFKYCWFSNYYIAINIKWLKMCNKSRRTSVLDITRYLNTYLILARLLGCLCRLPFHDVALDDIKHPWCHAKNCHTHVQNLTPKP